MRIFLTGATGYIGAAVLDGLLRAEHDVTALVRDNEKASRLAERGVRAVVGDLAEPESYRAATDAQDGYIHTAFVDAPGRAAAVDRAALDVMLEAARRRRAADGGEVLPGPFIIYTSAAWVVGPSSQPADESAVRNPVLHEAWRPEIEDLLIASKADGVRTIIVRPGVVYGRSRGLVGDLFKQASNGLVRVVGDGNNRWPLVYDRDLADLYARLVASEDAAGIYHANDEGDERINDIIEAIAPHLAHRPDVRHVPLEEARSKMGTIAEAMSLDVVVRSPRARALGWAPSLHSVAGNAARLLEEWRADQSANASRSSASAPGSRSKNASRLRSSARLS